MGVLAYDESCSGKLRRVVEVVAVGHAFGVSGGPQAFGGRGGLMAGVVLDGPWVPAWWAVRLRRKGMA